MSRGPNDGEGTPNGPEVCVWTMAIRAIDVIVKCQSLALALFLRVWSCDRELVRISGGLNGPANSVAPQVRGLNQP